MTARKEASAAPDPGKPNPDKTDLKKRIAAAVAPDLLAVEAALRDNLNAHLDLVAEVAGHLLFREASGSGRC